MLEVINANILAQMANDQIEEVQVSNVLKEQCETIPASTDEEHHDYDRLFAVNRLSRASKVVLEAFRSRVIELLKKRRTKESVTITLGSRMFKFYYNRYFTWQNLHLQPKKDETAEEKELREKVEAALAEYNEIVDKMDTLETELRIQKQKKKVAEETLAALLPNSDCIKYTPVLQVSSVDE